tara:strand:- start:5030 stop:6265 length:1236 start_codon:yes stop_codon:yes gene_type:complete
MRFILPRGIIYHKLSEDLLFFFKSFFCNLSNKSIIEKWEKKFAEYNNRKYCLSFPFARTALYYALKSQNFPPGSEIILPPITIKGMLDVVINLKLKPVYVDINLDTLCFDSKQLNNSINSKTRAILLTYLFGIVPDIDKLIEISKKNRLFIIEDFSHALNARQNNKKLGTFGDIGIYSSSSIKTLDTYGGGHLICDDSNLYESLLLFKSKLVKPSRFHLIKKIFIDLYRNLATSKGIFDFFVFPFLVFLFLLDPKKIIKQTGNRSKKKLNELPKVWFESFTSFQAYIGLKYISYVDLNDDKRIFNVNYIKSNTNNLKYPLGNKEQSYNVYWQFITYFENFEKIQKNFIKNRIDTASTSLELISSLKSYPNSKFMPNASYLHKNGIFIPSYPGIKDFELERICKTINKLSND